MPREASTRNKAAVPPRGPEEAAKGFKNVRQSHPGGRGPPAAPSTIDLAEQSTGMSGASHRSDWAWMYRATISLPALVSPKTMTVHCRGATVEATDLIEFIAAERPTSETRRAYARRTEGARNVALPDGVPFIRQGVSS
jgi:hypothetical protein